MVRSGEKTGLTRQLHASIKCLLKRPVARESRSLFFFHESTPSGACSKYFFKFSFEFEDILKKELESLMSETPLMRQRKFPKKTAVSQTPRMPYQYCQKTCQSCQIYQASAESRALRMPYQYCQRPCQSCQIY